MKYIKTFELFDFFQKKGPKMEWREALDFLMDNYKSVKINSIKVDDDYSTISWSYKSNDYRSSIVRIGDEYKHASLSPMKDWPEISEQDFNRWYKGLEEISDYLDEQDKYFKVGKDSEDLSMEDMMIRKAKNELKKAIGKYMNKPLKFEAEFYVWDSNSSNKKKIEDISIKITDFDIGVTSYINGDKNNLYFTFKCTLKGQRWEFDIFKDNVSEYIPINDIPEKDKFKLVIKMSRDESNMSRREIRNQKNVYPKVISYDMVPSEWNSIEFTKECQNIINLI